MKTHLTRLFAVLSTYLFLLGSAQAALIQWQTVLSGLNEIPVVVSPGSGTGVVTYDDVAHTLQVSMTWADLVGNTTVSHLHAPATAAQIAAAVAFNGTWGVATQPGTFTGFPGGTTSGSYVGLAYSLLSPTNYTAGFLAANGGTAALAEAALLSYLDSGKAYLNIHTTFRPGGEIKGYLTRVPDTASTGLLLLLALCSVLQVARSRQLAA